MAFGKLGAFGSGFGSLGSVGSGVGVPPNTLVASPGSFLFSGDTMTPLIDYRLPAVGGSFAMTGQVATLRHAVKLAAAGGSFAMTGQAATLTPATGFTPASLSPSWWLEVGKGGLFQSNAGTTAAVSDGDVVGYAPDQSAAAFTITSVADDTTRPTLQGVGVFPYLSYDGSNDLLRRTAALDGWNAGSSTWCFTFRSNSNAVNAIVAASRSSSGTGPCYCLFKADAGTATTQSILVRDDASANVTGLTQFLNTNVFNGSDHVIMLIDNGSSIVTYLDGSLVNGDASYTHTQTLTLNRFSLGASLSTSAAAWWAGRIYGGVIIDGLAVDATQRANLTTYMGNLAGLTL